MSFNIEVVEHFPLTQVNRKKKLAKEKCVFLKPQSVLFSIHFLVIDLKKDNHYLGKYLYYSNDYVFITFSIRPFWTRFSAPLPFPAPRSPDSFSAPAATRWTLFTPATPPRTLSTPWALHTPTPTSSGWFLLHTTTEAAKQNSSALIKFVWASLCKLAVS